MELASSVQAIRFIDFTHSREQFRYTIALVWTLSNNEVRDRLFDLAPTIVKATGWYPLPQGERIGSRLAKTKRDSILGSARIPCLNVDGRLQGISSAVQVDGGCSIRIRLSEASLLFDSGLPRCLQADPSDRAIFVSHLHSDHMGGVEAGGMGDIHVVLPRRTAHILLAQRRLRYSDIGSRTHLISPEDGWQRIGQMLDIMAFQVPHAPGSVGYAIRDPNAGVVFTGDIVIRTARHDFLPQLERVVRLVERQDTTILIDATMASRKAGASAANAAKALLAELEQVGELAVISRDSEQLLYAYLDLFHVCRESCRHRHQVDFLLTPSLKPLFAVIHAAFIGRELGALDPLLAAQYGASMSAWAESRFLYWLDRQAVLPRQDDRKRVWFLTPGELEEFALPATALIALVGKVTSADSQGREVIAVDTSPWTLHSDSDSLRSAADALSEHARVVLFHDFPKRLRRFAHTLGPSVHVLTRDEIPVRINAV